MQALGIVADEEIIALLLVRDVDGVMCGGPTHMGLATGMEIGFVAADAADGAGYGEHGANFLSLTRSVGEYPEGGRGCCSGPAFTPLRPCGPLPQRSWGRKLVRNCRCNALIDESSFLEPV